MAKPRNETPQRRIMRLIRTAFQAAEIGEDAKARNLMDTAIKNGAVIADKTAKGFEIAIAKGIRDTRR